MKELIFKIIFFSLLLAFISCNKVKPIQYYKQFNITILIDLSDRIDPDLNPNQIQYDKALILSVVDLIKKSISEKGTFNSNDRINIYFYPHSNSNNLYNISQSLNFDLSKLEPKDKKIKFNELDSLYKKNLDQLYSEAIKDGKYSGSDIWSFFKDEVKDKCTLNDSSYSNVLIILTDGYLYWENTKLKSGNRYTYINIGDDHLMKFRNKSKWENIFDKEDYGFMNVNTDLQKLKIICLEFKPSEKSPQDYDILKKYWEKWFKEMNLKSDNIKIVKSDLPNNTIPILERFILNSN